jgi:hypothetical protein
MTANFCSGHSKGVCITLIGDMAGFILPKFSRAFRVVRSDPEFQKVYLRNRAIIGVVSEGAELICRRLKGGHR